MSVPPVRSTKNRQIEEKDSGAHFDHSFNAPAHETANARVHLIGPFRKANLTVSMTPTAMTLGGVDADAPVSVLAHSAGKILGIQYGVNALITAGGASSIVVEPTIAPLGVDANVAVAGGSTAIASAATGNPQRGVVDLAETNFNKGDALGIQIVSTSGTLVPATTDDFACWLIVRYSASPGVPA